MLPTLIVGPSLAAEAPTIAVCAERTLSVTGGDDVVHLRQLALAVGWEFGANSVTDAYLKDLAIKRIRCINIDRFPGEFDAQGNYHIYPGMTTRLDQHLWTCAQVGALPHLVIGPAMPEALSRRAEPKETREGIMGNVGVSGRIYGPSDYTLYRNYFVAVFAYLLLAKGLRDAEFEASNKPNENHFRRKCVT